ncbi:MAG: hypothetical protein KME55_39280 [Nostoc indistinguendum CM1-VF10]|jgi:hypothetical protein|nr:hypothetical protein [Nostoc indistinguendum CM1-VF10]
MAVVLLGSLMIGKVDAMNKLGAGIALITIAAFLFGINYLAISISAAGLIVRSCS